MSDETQVKPCGWCGETTPGHRHYAVLIYEHGKCLGRLASAGKIANRKIFALIMSKSNATRIAEEITADTSNDFIAKRIPF